MTLNGRFVRGRRGTRWSWGGCLCRVRLEFLEGAFPQGNRLVTLKSSSSNKWILLLLLYHTCSSSFVMFTLRYSPLHPINNIIKKQHSPPPRPNVVRNPTVTHHPHHRFGPRWTSGARSTRRSWWFEKRRRREKWERGGGWSVGVECDSGRSFEKGVGWSWGVKKRCGLYYGFLAIFVTSSKQQWAKREVTGVVRDFMWWKWDKRF